MDPRRPVVLYTTDNAIEAELLRNQLVQQEIVCTLEGTNQAGFAAIFPIQVLVREQDLLRARQVLDEHLQAVGDGLDRTGDRPDKNDLNEDEGWESGGWDSDEEGGEGDDDQRA